MFEKYTEKARRVIFFGRYEANQMGSPYIEVEHLLLGLLREDRLLANNMGMSLNTIRKQITPAVIPQPIQSAALDLPLSHASKRVLAYGSEEAERLMHKHIGTEHVLLGLLREAGPVTGKIFDEHKVKLSRMREQIAAATPQSITFVGEFECRFILSKAAERADGRPITPDDLVAGILAWRQTAEDLTAHGLEIDEMRETLKSRASRPENVRTPQLPSASETPGTAPA